MLSCHFRKVCIASASVIALSVQTLITLKLIANKALSSNLHLSPEAWVFGDWKRGLQRERLPA